MLLLLDKIEVMLQNRRISKSFKNRPLVTSADGRRHLHSSLRRMGGYNALLLWITPRLPKQIFIFVAALIKCLRFSEFILVNTSRPHSQRWPWLRWPWLLWPGCDDHGCDGHGCDGYHHKIANLLYSEVFITYLQFVYYFNLYFVFPWNWN